MLLMLLAACNGFSICAAQSTIEANVYTEDKDGITLGVETLRWDTYTEGGEATCSDTTDTGAQGSCSSWIVEDPAEGDLTFTATRGHQTATVTNSFELSDDCPATASDLTLLFDFDGGDTGN